MCTTFLLHVSIEPNHFVQGAQENYDGYGIHFPAADPPEGFPGVRPYPAPSVDNPPVANGLGNRVGYILNNTVMPINIMHGPDGRIRLRITLELSDDITTSPASSSAPVPIPIPATVSTPLHGDAFPRTATQHPPSYYDENRQQPQPLQHQQRLGGGSLSRTGLRSPSESRGM